MPGTENRVRTPSGGKDPDADETTVLLVDDEIPFVETMSLRLSKRGIRVIPAFSGQEALARLEGGAAVQVVILDIRMPGMDGLETLAHIKREHPSVEVIILTGQATVHNAIRGMKLGAFEIMSKPCELEELVKKIRQAAYHRRP